MTYRKFSDILADMNLTPERLARIEADRKQLEEAASASELLLHCHKNETESFSTPDS